MNFETAKSLFAKVGIVDVIPNNTGSLSWVTPHPKQRWRLVYVDAIIYALIDKGQVVYIGRVVNQYPSDYRCIQRSSTRLQQHKCTKEYDQILVSRMVRARGSVATDCERCFILLAQPKYNKQYWRPSKKLNQ
jgi:hypothetical protein